MHEIYIQHIRLGHKRETSLFNIKKISYWNEYHIFTNETKLTNGCCSIISNQELIKVFIGTDIIKKLFVCREVYYRDSNYIEVQTDNNNSNTLASYSYINEGDPLSLCKTYGTPQSLIVLGRKKRPTKSNSKMLCKLICCIEDGGISSIDSVCVEALKQIILM
jgi:hypothetical protein